MSTGIAQQALEKDIAQKANKHCTTGLYQQVLKNRHWSSGTGQQTLVNKH
jgi:hypothetical protein